MSGFFNNCAESGAYKEKEIEGAHGYLVNGIKYCDTIKDVCEFCFIPKSKIAKALRLQTCVNLEGFEIRIVSKRKRSRPRTIKDIDKWNTRMRHLLDGTESNVELRK